MGKKNFCFFQTAETGNRTPNSGVKGSGANHHPIGPRTLSIGEFEVRVFCDNNRTECKHCGLTSHMHYKCPARTVREKRCYRCFSTSHMVQECTNDVACRYCCQTGHVEKDCEDHKELTDRKKYGEYYHDIIEGNMKDDKETENDEGSSTSLRQAEQNKQVSAVKVKDNHSKSAATSTEADDDNGVAEKADTNNKIHTLILGDSNMKNIQNPSGVHIQAESGATLLPIKNLTGTASKQLDISDIKSVGIHLGTNDVTRHDSRETILNVTSAIDHAKEEFPKAGIAIASVPPREGSEHSQKKANEATACVNSYLQAQFRADEQKQCIISTLTHFWPQKVIRLVICTQKLILQVYITITLESRRYCQGSLLH